MTEQPKETNEAAGGASDVERGVRQCSPDDLMRMNPKMSACASILIEACKKSVDGRKALAQWDKYRGA